ncbi:MAG: polyprenyl diphosphate synthase [Patescibacteria group bacterium]|jgi:undecaprenyl diphosphate synthase
MEKTAKTTPAVPVHLGVIMDGNRRWAKDQGVTYEQAYQKGIEVLRMVVRQAADAGTRFVTAFTFSHENWNRPKEEVTLLMRLLKMYMEKKVRELHKENVRFKVIGRLKDFSDMMQRVIHDAVALTAANTGITLTLALNYGGQTELVDAVNALVEKNSGEITPEDIQKHLYDPEQPPVDLIIRTSGEQRTSGFLLWESAYAELFFLQKNWPALAVEDITLAYSDFAQRKRNFGS